MLERKTSLAVLDYATPSQDLPHTRYGIAGMVVLVADIIWCFIDRPFLWPKQEQVELFAWFLGVALMVNAYCAKQRSRLFAHASAVLVVVTFLVWSICLPSI